MPATITFLTFVLWIRLSMSLNFLNSSEWAAPYVLRVTSQNSQIDGLYVTKSVSTYTPGRISGLKIDPKQNVSDAYLLFPSGSSYAPQTFSKSGATLFDSEYGTPYNSSQLIVIGNRRTGYGNPDYFSMTNDYGPGVLHVWSAETVVAAWGWEFLKDNGTRKEYLRSNSFDDGWKWLGYMSFNDTWSVSLWNYSAPNPFASDDPKSNNQWAEIDLELVPLRDV
ncbi:hypothetical protein N431DRAFT_472227 [Stipitochalara longipes BDJ]|nr:hypothetical protein N431DRAFT_472227 [Stipitochalara longipes BDJ]